MRPVLTEGIDSKHDARVGNPVLAIDRAVALQRQLCSQEGAIVKVLAHKRLGNGRAHAR